MENLDGSPRHLVLQTGRARRERGSLSGQAKNAPEAIAIASTYFFMSISYIAPFHGVSEYVGTDCEVQCRAHLVTLSFLCFATGVTSPQSIAIADKAEERKGP